MTRTQQLSPAVMLLSAGLIVAGVGVFIQFVTGVPGFPPIPPGPIILIGAGLLVALLPWRWTPVIGLIAALFVSVGTVLANRGTRPRPLTSSPRRVHSVRSSVPSSKCSDSSSR